METIIEILKDMTVNIFKMIGRGILEMFKRAIGGEFMSRL